MRVVLLGAPGAGKGTQAEKLAEKLQIPHLSTGELFRHNISTGTKLGLEAKRYLDAGDLVPTELTNELVDDRLTEPDTADGFILDGYPRSVPQAQALHDMLEPDRVTQHLERGVIEVAPLAYMRGRSLNDSFIILDEAQNTSPEQMQMFLTRLGFGSQMVITGDVTQIDLPHEQASGLVEVQSVLEGVDGISFVRFGDEDVVRHRMVQRIVEAYRRHVERASGGFSE